MNNMALTATGLDIVEKAFNILGASDRNRPLTASLREMGFISLNYLVKALQVNYHLWTETQAVIPLKTGVVEYDLGPNGTQAANKDQFLKLTSDSVSPVGTTVNVTGNIATGDTLGVIHSDGSIQWSTVVSYTTGAAVISDALIAELPASSVVYSYTDILERPIRVVNCRYQATLSGGDTPTSKWNATQYYETADKTLTGSVQAWYYSPQLTDGILSIYKAPTNNNSFLNITYVRPINIAVNNGDDIDFPSEWFLPLAYMLAEEMMTEVDTPDQAAQNISMLASKYSQSVGIVPLGKLQPMPEAGA